jgi:hypothetical protein
MLSLSHRWLIELPSKAMPTKEMRDLNVSALGAITNIIVPYSTKADFIDSIYEIVEILQKICSKMNLYFGKKVCGMMWVGILGRKFNFFEKRL